MSDQPKDPYAGLTLMQKAALLLEKSFVAKYENNDEETSDKLLDEAAATYDEAGSPRDAEAVRLFKNGKVIK